METHTKFYNKSGVQTSFVKIIVGVNFEVWDNHFPKAISVTNKSKEITSFQILCFSGQSLLCGWVTRCFQKHPYCQKGDRVWVEVW